MTKAAPERPTVRCLMCGLEGIKHEITCSTCRRDTSLLNFDVEIVEKKPLTSADLLDWRFPKR